VAGAFYYLLSSLPYLDLHRPMPIARADFLARCQEQLAHADYAQLTELGRIPRETACCETEARWNAWETALRNCFVRLRAARRNDLPDAWLHPESETFAELERQVFEAFDGTNPREERLALDQLRWQRLCELELGHTFDFEALVIYHLKLILLEKWANLNVERGLAALDEIVQARIPQLAFVEHGHAKP